MDVVLSEQRIKVAATDPLAAILLAELRAFSVKTTATGSEQFAALRERDHDDIVMATALAVWVAEKKPAPVNVPMNWFVR